MKKTLFIAGSLVSSVAFAGQPVFHPIGSSLTLGSVTNIRALSSSLANPASPYLMVNSAQSDSFRFGIIGPGGFGYEFGEVDSMMDQIDELQTTLDKDDLTAEDGLAAQAKFNDFLKEAGDNGYFKGSTAGLVPLFPIIYKTKDKGAFSVDFVLAGAFKGNVLDDDITLDIDTSGTETQVSLETQASIYGKTVGQATFGLGYSNEVWSNSHGSLVAGAKANITSMTLGKNLLTIGGLEEDDVGTAFTDEFSDNLTTTVNVGLDLGVLWITPRFIAGVSATNLNEPEYDYGDLGQNCSSKTGAAQANCFVARSFAEAGDIDLNETHVASRQVTFEGSASINQNKNWSVQGAYDLLEANDPVGDKYQWAVVSASYYGDSNLLPGFRAGYRKNMTGTELSYVDLGFTVFKRLNIDFGWSLESVDMDGTDLPRSMYVNAGIESAF